MTNVELRVTQILQIRKKIEEVNERYKQELEPLKGFIDKASGEIIAFLQSSNQKNARTNAGTAYLSQKTSYSQESPEEFQRHIIGTEAWELVDWKPNKTAIDAFRLATGGKMDGELLIGGALPPGVKMSELITLGVRSPTTRKTPAATTPSATPVQQMDTL